MKCWRCGALMEPRMIPVEELLGVAQVAEQVPGYACPSCGEEIVEGPALVAMERQAQAQ